MPVDAEQDEQLIRSVSRALSLLRVMNTRQSWSLQELHRALGLPKSTLFRLLHTLQVEGYVRAEGGAGSYRLSSKVHELGGGYTQKSLLVDVGAPIALRMTKQIKWPLAIGTLDGDALVVRYSTMPYSPVAVHATTLGQRLGLLETAMGRVYLAYCEPTERDILLRAWPALDGGNTLCFSGGDRVRVQNTGMSPGSNGTFRICDSRGPSQARGLVISNQGRTRSATVAACP